MYRIVDTYVSPKEHLYVNRVVKAYGIDQQGGKGSANYTEDVAPTVLSDSHGTPHGVAIIEKSSKNVTRKKSQKSWKQCTEKRKSGIISV